MTPERFEELLSGFKRHTIALVGDLFLDRYLELTADVEHSIETGLEAYQIHRVRNSPGALGTIINNLSALGVGRLLPVTVIGADGHGFDLRQSLQGLPLEDAYVLSDPDRLTPTYTKPLRPQASQGSEARSSLELSWTELNRLDVRTRGPLSLETEAELLQAVEAAWGLADGVIVLDQISDEGCGVVNCQVRDVLHKLNEQDPGKLMIVDSRECLGDFPSGNLKGNRREILQAAGFGKAETSNESEASDLRQALESLRARRQQRIFCTDGPEGIWIADEQGIRQVSGQKVSGPVDIVGAGDSVTAMLTACLLSGANADEAAELANAAASISIRKIGQTGVATPAELRAVISPPA